MQNILTTHYEIAEKIKKVRFIEESEFTGKIQELFDSKNIVVSGEYLEGGDEFKYCKAHFENRSDLFISIGFRRGNGKLSIYKVEVEAMITALLDPSTFTKVIHVSHDDLDGESPLIFSRLAFSDKKLITRGCSYDKVDEIVMGLIDTEMKKEDTVMFITDISVNPENLNRIHTLVQQGYRIFIIDHHDAKKDVPVKKYASWLKLDQTYPDGRGTAATSMYYEFLIEHGFMNRSLVMDDYVELVRLYDTWEWDDIANEVTDQEEVKNNIGIRAKRLNDYYFMGNREEFSEQVIMRFTDRSEGVPALFMFDYHVEYMLDMEQKRIDEFCKKKKKQLQICRGLVDGTDRIYSYGVTIAETYQSELGNYLCKEFIEEVDFIVMIDVGRAKMSLRSNKKKPINVGEIARSVDGGGRAQTAGCPLNTKTKHLFLDPILMNVVVQ